MLRYMNGTIILCVNILSLYILYKNVYEYGQNHIITFSPSCSRLCLFPPLRVQPSQTAEGEGHRGGDGGRRGSVLLRRREAPGNGLGSDSVTVLFC